MLKIKSEEPKEHWRFLNPKDKVVLDLGCGKFYSSISTAQWFLDQGASQVIGVDLSKEPITSDRFIGYAKAISSKEDLEYFLKYKPQIIKVDIEGAEKYFDKIASLEGVECITIEYHSNELKQLCEKKFADWGFSNLELYQLFDEDINRIGVWHAWK